MSKHIVDIGDSRTFRVIEVSEETFASLVTLDALCGKLPLLACKVADAAIEADVDACRHNENVAVRERARDLKIKATEILRLIDDLRDALPDLKIETFSQPVKKCA